MNAPGRADILCDDEARALAERFSLAWANRSSRMKGADAFGGPRAPQFSARTRARGHRARARAPLHPVRPGSSPSTSSSSDADRRRGMRAPSVAPFGLRDEARHQPPLRAASGGAATQKTLEPSMRRALIILARPTPRAPRCRPSPDPRNRSTRARTHPEQTAAPNTRSAHRDSPRERPRRRSRYYEQSEHRPGGR